MTVVSDVKQCLASLKGIEASLSSLAERTQDGESKKTVYVTMTLVSEIVTDLKKRVGELESEEYQYKGY